MKLLGIPTDIFTAGVLAVEQESSRRLAAVRAFYDHAHTPQLLRRACLCLRLTLFSTSITAQKSSSDEPQREPTMVRLGRREVQARTCQLFCDMVNSLANDPDLDPDDAIAGLLITQAHIVIRFDQYARFPTSLWKLTHKYNSCGYASEILDFLRLDDRFLDGGYSALLKQEAWAVANSVEADAVAYLMSDIVQTELEGIFEKGASISLVVERKHNQDKQSETKKVTSCSTASRNSIIRRYRVFRARELGDRSVPEKKYKASLRMNVRALAIKKNPDLFSRAKGKLRWQQAVSAAQQREIAHAGDEDALQKYIVEHRVELEQELSDLREQARSNYVASSALPLSSEDWLQHLEDNDEKFASLLKDAEKARRSVSMKIQASEDFDSASRVYPLPCKEHGHAPRLSHLRSGFFCFRPKPSETMVCYVASIGTVVYACPLSATVKRNEFDMVLAMFESQFKPMPLVLDDWGIDETAESYSLTWTASSFAKDRVTIRMTGAEKVRRPVHDPSADSVASDVDIDFDNIGLLTALDEDVDSVCSSDDSDVSGDSEASDQISDEIGSTDSEEEMAMAARKAPGTFVYYSNGDFTFTDNVAYPDIKCNVVHRWCTKDGMGEVSKSKTVVPAHFGDSREAPTRAKLVLRSWMLWKVATGDFVNKRASRRRLFAAEAKCLRHDIISMSSEAKPSTGNAAADKLIASCTPQIMAANVK